MLKYPKYCTLFHTTIPQPVQNSESVLMDMFFPVVSTENDDNEITIIEENIPTTPTIMNIRKTKRN